MSNRTYISTLCFTGTPISKILDKANNNNFNLEFSSGLPYNPNNINFFNNFNKNFKLLHNYFPAPKVPFVINLASQSKEIRELSLTHCLKNIELSAKNKIDFYSAHAGFCIDPQPDSLGKFIQIEKKFQRSHHIDIFLESLNKILTFAESLNVNFYIENNVVSKQNYIDNKNVNSFLCCDAEEINYFFKEINKNNFGLLLDTAHLKVSSSTLKLDKVKEVEKILDKIKVIHHSDNDGKVDSNEPIDNEYWFLKFKKYYSLWDHVIEVKNIDTDTINKQIELLN